MTALVVHVSENVARCMAAGFIIVCVAFGISLVVDAVRRH